MPKTQTAKSRSIPKSSTPSLTESTQPAPTPNQPASTLPLVLVTPTLKLAAEVLDDLEKVWVANANRLRQLTRSGEDSDGEMRGFGLSVEHPSVARQASIVEGLENLTAEATKALEKEMRGSLLGPWVKAQKGIGDKQGARLLAVIGDPYIRPPLKQEADPWEPSRPRLVSELWAYCGFHVLDSGVAPARRRGQLSNWSEDARKRAWLISASIIKSGGPYREVYDETRARYADATHVIACVRCGPSGKPAQPGSPLSLGHQHARAMRMVSKTVLRDLWREAKRLHEEAAE